MQYLILNIYVYTCIWLPQQPYQLNIQTNGSYDERSCRPTYTYQICLSVINIIEMRDVCPFSSLFFIFSYGCHDKKLVTCNVFGCYYIRYCLIMRVEGCYQDCLVLHGFCIVRRFQWVQKSVSVHSSGLYKLFFHQMDGITMWVEVGCNIQGVFVRISYVAKDTADPQELTVRNAFLTVMWLGSTVQQITVRVCWIAIQIRIQSPIPECPERSQSLWIIPW